MSKPPINRIPAVPPAPPRRLSELSSHQVARCVVDALRERLVALKASQEYRRSMACPSQARMAGYRDGCIDAMNGEIEFLEGVLNAS